MFSNVSPLERRYSSQEQRRSALHAVPILQGPIRPQRVDRSLCGCVVNRLHEDLHRRLKAGLEWSGHVGRGREGPLAMCELESCEPRGTPLSPHRNGCPVRLEPSSAAHAIAPTADGLFQQVKPVLGTSRLDYWATWCSARGDAAWCNVQCVE